MYETEKLLQLGDAVLVLLNDPKIRKAIDPKAYEQVREAMFEAIPEYAVAPMTQEERDAWIEGSVSQEQGQKPAIGEWEKVGYVGVDAGCVWIGDPCYIEDGTPWQNGASSGRDVRQYHQGVCVSSGLGDGGYDVFVKYVDLPFWGKRVAEVKVVFIGEEDL